MDKSKESPLVLIYFIKARSVIKEPDLLIFDEATSALDADRRAAFLELLFRECTAAGSAIVFVSHDASAAHGFDRCIELADINEAA